MEGASLTDAVNALWEDFGLAGLDSIGIEGDEASIIWEQQLKKPKPLKTFLKGLDSSRKKAQQKAKFPYRNGVLPGAVGAIHDLILTGLLEGPELLNVRRLLGMMTSIVLLQVGLGYLQPIVQQVKIGTLNHSLEIEGAWMEATKNLLEEGKLLLDSEQADSSGFVESLKALYTATGQQEPLPDHESA